MPIWITSPLFKRTNAKVYKKKRLFPSDDIEFRGTMHTREFIRVNVRFLLVYTCNFVRAAAGVNALFYRVNQSVSH